MNVWARISKSNPCPICGKGDWCCVDKNTGAVCCMRIQSDKSLANGGWLHNGSAAQRLPQTPTQRKDQQKYEEPEFDAELWWQTMRRLVKWNKIEPWANSLGLPASAMDVMGACTLGPMLTFPMYDGAGNVCGIRTRNQDGSKKAIAGSRAGVFLPTFYDEAEPIICEGPTDATAAMALGYWPIGRPSCTGCERHVIDTCKRIGIKRITICSDSDGPGIAGASRLSDILHAAKISIRMVIPGAYKDLRDWFKSGVSKQIVDLQWSQAEWRA